MVRAFGVERLGERQAQGTERRGPGKAEAGRVAQVVELDAVVEHVAAVDEPGEPQRLVLQRAGYREEDLGARGELAVAAERGAEFVDRAEAERAVAAHRAGAAGVVVLEERQRIAAPAFGL